MTTLKNYKLLKKARKFTNRLNINIKWQTMSFLVLLTLNFMNFLDGLQSTEKFWKCPLHYDNFGDSKPVNYWHLSRTTEVP